MAVLQLTEKEFAKAVCGEGVSAVLEFYADWCKPCHKMFPMIERLSEEYENVKFYKINSDEEFLLVGAFKAATLPTLVFVKDGVVIDVEAGVVGEDRVLECINKIL